MNLDDLLRDTLSDDRWALPVPADTLPAVRRKRTQRRALATIATATGAAAAVVALALTVGGSGGTEPIVTLPATSAGPTAAASPTPSSGCDVAPPTEPVPGSTPAYLIGSARDWFFLTKAQSDAFFRDYRETDRVLDGAVPSPQPSGPGTDRLVAEMSAAGVPGTPGLHRDEAESGRPGSLVVQGQLPDGRGLYVSRGRALYPVDTAAIAGPFPETASVEDVPGTACAAFIYTGLPKVPGGHAVQVMAPDGTTTGWLSETIPIAQLKAWAFAAAQWADAHPVS